MPTSTWGRHLRGKENHDERILIVVILLAIPACFGQQTAKVRTYYIAADELDWD
ncbi:MAG: hypothetical protein ABR881_26010 [Candidatus Sulfotelmatobacter sp.]